MSALPLPPPDPLDSRDLERAERELVTALSVQAGDESDRDTRLADWATWWGWRLVSAVRRGK